MMKGINVFKAGFLLGRLSNGYELDKGSIIHAIDGLHALCGAKPGKRSAGWSTDTEHDINCSRCLKKINKVIQQSKDEESE